MIIQFFVFLLCLIFKLSATDIEYFVTYIAERHIHGSRDDKLPYYLSKHIVDDPIIQMTCTSISNFSVQYLKEKGFQVRFILILTLEEWNEYDNGHSLIEVWNGTQWTLWDIDLKNIFKRDGRQISAWEMIEGDYEIERFASGEILTPEAKLATQRYNIDLDSEEGLRRFYNRHAQVLMIRAENGKFYFTCDPIYRIRVESYPYSGPFIFMEKSQFIQYFYEN